jgi:NAD(P)-dependent dehydrogenase (short-subunit alcohol dehydrogenase family)
MLRVNTVAPVMVTRAFLPLLEKAEHPKVVHIGSWLGSIALKKNGGNYSYAVSKSALNMMNRALAYDIQPKNIISVVINPGWTQTIMGGSKAQFTVEESVENMYKVVNGLKLSDTGNFFNYNGELHPY